MVKQLHLSIGVLTKTLLVLSLALFSASAQASPPVSVQAARLTESNRGIEVDVFYGGCDRQSFKLEVGKLCGQSLPASCAARVVSLGSSGPCRMAIRETLTFELTDEELNIVRGSILSVYGSNDSSASLAIPR
jgi:hypothetical protein